MHGPCGYDLNSYQPGEIKTIKLLFSLTVFLGSKK